MIDDYNQQNYSNQPNKYYNTRHDQTNHQHQRYNDAYKSINHYDRPINSSSISTSVNALNEVQDKIQNFAMHEKSNISTNDCYYSSQQNQCVNPSYNKSTSNTSTNSYYQVLQ